MASPTQVQRARPISPHLQVWRWGPHMVISVLHRITGSGLATVGTGLLVWWLAALAAGEESYTYFLSWFTGPWAWLGYVVGIGLTLSMFQHMMTGIRHFFLDAGAGYELKINKQFSVLTMFAAVTLTALYWFYIVAVK